MINSVTLIGRLTKDVEVRVSNDLTIARFTVAINRMPGKDGKDRGADFIRCVVFGKTAENCERFIGKGSQVGVQGRIQTGSYEDKDGKMVYTTDVVADRVEFLDSRKSAPAPTEGENYEGFEQVNEDDIPF